MKPQTSVRDCVSIFVRVKPLDTFKETSRHLTAVFVVTRFTNDVGNTGKTL